MTIAHSQQRGDLQALATTCLHTIYTPAQDEVEPESELSAEVRIGVNISGELTFAAPAIVASTRCAVQVLQQHIAEPSISKYENLQSSSEWWQ